MLPCASASLVASTDFSLSVCFVSPLIACSLFSLVLDKIRSGAPTLPALDQIIAYASSGTIPTYLFPVGATARNRKAPWCRHAPSAIAYAANDLSCSVAIYAPCLKPPLTLAVATKNPVSSINGQRYSSYRRNNQSESFNFLVHFRFLCLLIHANDWPSIVTAFIWIRARLQYKLTLNISHVLSMHMTQPIAICSSGKRRKRHSP